VAGTHAVTNQPPPLVGRDLLADDPALVEWVVRLGAGGSRPSLHELGILAGSAETRRLAFEADTNPPVLTTHDRYGNRIDEVTFHPAWHRLMTTGVASGLTA